MSKSKQQKNKSGGILGKLGILLIIIVIMMCLPLVAIRLLGYDVYHVISGSMEPTIPIGSMIVVESVEPEMLGEQEIIAFYGQIEGNAIITHRVVENNTLTGELITKGDANASTDLEPIPYNQVIGKVVVYLPYLGSFLAMLTSFYGKIAAACLVLLGIVLQLFDK